MDKISVSGSIKEEPELNVASKIEQKKSRDITYITSTRMMVDTLKSMFPDSIEGEPSNLGDHYDRTNENIFQNDYLQTL